MQADAPVSDVPPRRRLGVAGPCANCGAPLNGAFCAACGQRAVPLRQPVHRFLADAVVEYFGIDGRLWTSLQLLVLHPGRLTQEYLAGRRVRHLRPLRLYLSATLLFFFLLSLLDPVAELQSLISSGVAPSAELADSTATAAAHLAAIDSALAAFDAEIADAERLADSLVAAGVVAVDADRLDGSAASYQIDPDDVPEEQRARLRALGRLQSAGRQRVLARLRWQREELAEMAPDSTIRLSDWLAAAELVIPDPFNVNVGLPEWAPRSRPVQRLAQARTNDERVAAIADLTRNLIAHIPTVMFVLLPVFALLLKVIYVRRSWFYGEHLVFALHVHAFAFLVFAALAVLLWASGGAGWASAVASLVGGVGIPAYFFAAQKRVYGQGWAKTTVKALLLGGTYAILLFCGLIGAILLAASL